MTQDNDNILANQKGKQKLVLAYSGGLDTSCCLTKLSKGYEVHAVSVNTGGFNTKDIQEMKSKALQMGAKTYNPSMLWIPSTTRLSSIWSLVMYSKTMPTPIGER